MTDPDDILRHRYLERVAAQRREADGGGRHPLAGFWQCFGPAARAQMDVQWRNHQTGGRT